MLLSSFDDEARALTQATYWPWATRWPQASYRDLRPRNVNGFNFGHGYDSAITKPEATSWPERRSTSMPEAVPDAASRCVSPPCRPPCMGYFVQTWSDFSGGHEEAPATVTSSFPFRPELGSPDLSSPKGLLNRFDLNTARSCELDYESHWRRRQYCKEKKKRLLLSSFDD